MSVEEENREMQDLQKALGMLELTAHNQKLAGQYLDLSAPEDTMLLKEAEHQNFMNLPYNIKYDLYKFLEVYRETDAKLACRFTRFVAETGRETAQKILAYYELSRDYEYLGQCLQPIQKNLLYANAGAWNTRNFNARYIQPLVEIGTADPEVFWQMKELCCNEDGVNTKMFLAALYLYCVKPPEGTGSRLCVPAGQDQRAAGSPERIREMAGYLEHCLIRNIDGLFEKDDEPDEAGLKILEDFVQNSDPGAPVPVEVRAILSGRRRHDYRMAFLPWLAFLAVEHSDRFVSMIRLAVALDDRAVPNLPLDNCLAAGDDWFHRHILELEKVLEIPDDAYARWALLRRQAKILERMAVKAPEAVCEIMTDIPTADKGYLKTCVKVGNPRLYEEMKGTFADSYRRAAAEQLVGSFPVFKEEMLRYLSGEAEIADILPCMARWRELNFSGSSYARCGDIHSYMVYGEMQVYRRALVLECLHLERYYFYTYWIDPGLDRTENNVRYKDMDVRQVNSILQLLDEEKVPPQYQIEFLGTAYDCYYAPEQAANAGQECLEAIASCHGDWHQEWKAASQSRHLQSRVLAFRVMGVRWEEYKDELLSCASESSRQGRDFVRAAFVAHPEWEEDILGMLKSPRGAEREMAVEVLGNWGIEKYRAPLSLALESEKTKKIRTMIQNALAPDDQNGDWTLDKLIQETLTGAWKRKLSWLPLDTFPKVHKKDGNEASQEYLAALLISYADMKELGISKEAQRLAAELHTAELAAYVKEVYSYWLNKDEQAKHKWVLYAAAIHGGGTIVNDLYAQIQDWPTYARGAMAAEAVKALALNASPTALVLVDQISRKFKYPQVKAAAAQALDYAARQLGISRDEMEDRIVPGLGFDENAEQSFGYGKRQFKVVLTPALSLEVYDKSGKKLKNMPAPGKTDDPKLSKAAYDAWKQLKKQLKTVVTNQKLRLEQALSIERQWEPEKWKDVFVKNPVMHQFATGLVWGVYEGRKLAGTFRYMEDGTFNTVDEEEYTFPQTGSIGLVHPLELSQEHLSAWKEQMADYEIIQPIEQLDRPVYRVTEAEKEETELARFGGMVVNALSLSGKLLNMGWYKGEVGDGGSFDTYYRYDQTKNVELDFSGDGIVSLDMDVVVYGAHFGQARGESPALAPCKLGEVEPRYFSETVLQLTRATAASKETLPYPDCRKRHWH